MEEPNSEAKDKACTRGDLYKGKGKVLDEYQVDNAGFCWKCWPGIEGHTRMMEGQREA